MWTSVAFDVCQQSIRDRLTNLLNTGTGNGKPLKPKGIQRTEHRLTMLYVLAMPSVPAAMLDSSTSDLESFVLTAALVAALVNRSDGLTVELRWVGGTWVSYVKHLFIVGNKDMSCKWQLKLERIVRDRRFWVTLWYHTRKRRFAAIQSK